MTNEYFIYICTKLLLHTKVISKETILDEKSWLQLKEAGLTPLQSCLENIPGIHFPMNIYDLIL